MDRHVASAAHVGSLQHHDVAIQRIDAMKGGVGAGGHSLVQRELMERKKTVQALVVGSLAAGGHGAAGIPPSSIPSVFTRSFISLISLLEGGGVPAKSTIMRTTLLDAVQLVEERHKKALIGDGSGVDVSLYIDGGSSRHLANGRKVLVVVASSMEWSSSKLLHVNVLECHESAAIQADVIEAVCVYVI